MIENMSKTNSTTLNGANLTKAVHLYDGDLIVIVDRQFRFTTNRPTPTQRTPLIPKKTKSALAASKVSAAAKPADEENAAPNKAPASVKQSAAAVPVVVVAPVTALKTEEKQVEEKQADQEASTSTAAVEKKSKKEEKRARSNSLGKVEMKARVEAEPTPVLSTVTGTVATPKRKHKRTLAKAPKKPLTLATPLKQGIVERGAKEKIMYSKSAMPMPTPMRKSITAKGKSSKPAYEYMDKHLATPVKAAIKVKGSQPNTVFVAPEHTLATPMRNEIRAEGRTKATYEYLHNDKHMATPIKAGIVEKGSKPNPAFAAPEHTLATPIKALIVEKGSVPNAAFAPVEHTLPTPVRTELNEVVAEADRLMYAPKPTLETPVKKSIAQTAPKVTQAYNERIAKEAAEAEKAKLEAIAAAVAAAEAAEKATADQKAAEQATAEEEDEQATVDGAEAEEADAEEREGDDDDDDDDDIQVNMPVRQQTVADQGMKTPTRKSASKTPDGRMHVMYVNEHNTGTPMRDALMAAATPIAQAPVAVLCEAVRGLPSPIKLMIGAAATDAAIRRAVAAQKAIVAANAESNEQGLLSKASESQQFKLFTVDVDSAANAIEQQLAGLEEKMAGKCTKGQMEDAVRASIAAMRTIIGNLSDAGATVAADVVEKCIAINAVAEEQMAAKAEEAEPAATAVVVKVEPTPKAESEDDVKAEETVEEKPKTSRGRPRKSMTAAATTSTSTEKTPRRARKSAAHVVAEEPEPVAVAEGKPVAEESAARRRGRPSRK